MTGKLQGNVAIITGSTKGIGLAIAQSFVKEGAKVIISSRKAENVEAVARQINSSHPGSAFPLPLHVGKHELHRAFLDQVREQAGQATILVNNAAANPYSGPMVNMEWPAWHKTIEVNLTGPFGLSQLFIKDLLQAKRTGSIINITSIFGLAASPMQGAYGMTKAAVIAMTKTLAHELGGSGIRVNAIAPGLIDTNFASAIISHPVASKTYNTRCALGRPGQPHEIAGIATFLASDEASYATGQCFTIDGGYSSL